MGFYITTGTSAPGLKVGGVDLSDHVQSLQTPETYDVIDVTAMGASAHQSAPGLRNDSIVVTFFQDFAASKVDATLNPLLGNATGTTVIAYVNGTTASSTAPSYTLLAWLSTYTPIDASGPGTASMNQVTFLPVAGSNGIVRGTS